MQHFAATAETTIAFADPEHMELWGSSEISHHCRHDLQPTADHRELAKSILNSPRRAPPSVIQAAGDVIAADFVSATTLRLVKGAGQ